MSKTQKTNDFHKKTQRLKAFVDVQHCILKLIFAGNLFCGKTFSKNFFSTEATLQT